jgi:hypothetical protein
MVGTQLISVNENIDETPAGQLLHAIMAGIAEFYSQNLGAEALKGMTEKAKVGGTPGRAPIGYLNTRRRGEDGWEIRTVMVDPERAPLVQWAFEAYSSGEWTIRSLIDALAAKGLRALPHGKNLPGPVQTSHVDHMLSNRYYLGMVTFKGVEYQGRHQPLIPPMLFDRVQEVLARRPQHRRRDAPSPQPLPQEHRLLRPLRQPPVSDQRQGQLPVLLLRRPDTSAAPSAPSATCRPKPWRQRLSATTPRSVFPPGMVHCHGAPAAPFDRRSSTLVMEHADHGRDRWPSRCRI